MSQAMGVVETCGIPAALVTADILEKAANVRVVGLENVDAGRISIVIRGDTGAVKAAIAAAWAQLQSHPGAHMLGHHIIPCPDDATDEYWRGSRRNAQATDAVAWLDD